ncbi:Inherit from bctoNOG: GCN5-related N-acetyltransferase [Seminavis robusta]|uniref:Inherit from bctoNOG: GCN5-related N-acetyltransferase n=1 Tax=Seminavis robusta TaxID=568900 RepID=A0A9N8H3B8_9STRA|nr:Inherit from bctoNOG: GCN5-related N-acetyltransferase [Seminavis robusta]|eukprot:Sro35_g022450.1 Inherit from bctoNOG: GCN5-related N-acetyltransferase (227) ;mRNA; f:101781-102461
MTTIGAVSAQNLASPTTSAMNDKDSQETFIIAQATDADIEGILQLQAKNLPKNISKEEAESQGFVTIQHDFDVLQRMNSPHPHVVAKEPDTQKVIGYALVMLPEFRHDIPAGAPLVDQIDTVVYEGDRLGEEDRNSKTKKYVLVGQLCVAKEYRGQGISSAMYREYQRRMAPHFRYVVTAVDLRNTRSMRAHEKVGFQVVHRFGGATDASAEWAIMLFPTTKNKRR